MPKKGTKGRRGPGGSFRHAGPGSGMGVEEGLGEIEDRKFWSMAGDLGLKLVFKQLGGGAT